MLNTAFLGLSIGIIIVSFLGILAARFSSSRGDARTRPIGFSQPAASRGLSNLNKDDPEGMKLAGGGNAKNQFPAPGSGR